MIPEIRRRRSEVDSHIERQICMGLITSDLFLREIRSLCTPDSFQAPFARHIAQWCLEYHDQYKCVPGRSIEDIYLHRRIEVSEEDAGLLEEFLASLSDEYERSDGFNVKYIRDKAELHFRLTAIQALRDKVQKAIVAGKPDEAEAMVKEYRRPAQRQNQGVDPLRDVDFIVKALTPESNNPDIVMRLPGDLGEATGPLERGFLVAVQAESGVGKTWWLWMMAQQAVMDGFNTVFFSMEMSNLKMGQRMWQSVAGVPSVVIPKHQLSEDGQLLTPIFDCEKNQTGECPKGCQIALIEEGKQQRPEFRNAPEGYHPCSLCMGKPDFKPTAWWSVAGAREQLGPEVALEKHAQLERTGMLKRSGRFHLVEFPSRSKTMEDLITYLNNLEYYDNFIPSVIVTDYADKLKWSIPGDPRVSISEIWGGHKGLAQERHCLVITASQSNTMRSGKRVGRGSWAETIEKENLLDVGVALNQSATDQVSGIMRASLAKKRHGRMERTVEVMVLQQLAIGRPYIDSCRVVRDGEE